MGFWKPLGCDPEPGWSLHNDKMECLTMLPGPSSFCPVGVPQRCVWSSRPPPSDTGLNAKSPPKDSSWEGPVCPGWRAGSKRVRKGRCVDMRATIEAAGQAHRTRLRQAIRPACPPKQEGDTIAGSGVGTRLSGQYWETQGPGKDGGRSPPQAKIPRQNSGHLRLGPSLLHGAGGQHDVRWVDHPHHTTCPAPTADGARPGCRRKLHPGA